MLTPAGEPAPMINVKNQRLLRVEKMFFVARWVAVAFSVVQTFTFYKPFPPGYQAASFAVAGVLVVVTLLLREVCKRARTDAQVVRASIIGMAADLLAVESFIFLYTFDYDTAIWALVYLVPIIGATRFQLRGAVSITAVASVLYVIREIYGHLAFDYPFLWQSITFRLGIAWILAWTTGMMAATFTKESVVTEATNANLARMNETMSEFVAVTSHEMRTPITVIAGMTKLLRTKWNDLPDEKRQQMMQSMGRQADSLDQLVDDLLASSQIDAGTIKSKPQPMEVRPVVADTVEELLIEGIEVSVEDGLTMNTDQNHFKRTLVNLAVNAKKYGKAPIQIAVSSENTDVHMVIRDAGVGVPDEFVPHLFSRFARDGEASQTQPGTGLGLFIVQGLVTANDGEIAYANAAGGGAEFTIRYRNAKISDPEREVRPSIDA